MSTDNLALYAVLGVIVVYIIYSLYPAPKSGDYQRGYDAGISEGIKLGPKFLKGGLTIGD